MWIKYIEGTEKINLIPFGEFKRDIPREVPDDVGQTLIQKKSLKWVEVTDKPSRKKVETNKEK